MTVAFNIGYWSKTLGTSGVLTYNPVVWEVKDFRDFAKAIRRKTAIKEIFNWSKARCVIPSSMAVFGYIKEKDRNFRIQLINVREYRTAWEKKYKTTWKG